MTDFDQKAVESALKELREAVDIKTAGFDAGKIKKIETFLDEQEAKNQEVVRQLAAKDQEKKDLEERLGELETALSKPGNGGNEEDEVKSQMRVERKAFERFIAVGEDNLTPEELKYLRTDSDTDGGYLATPDFVQEIIKNITEISPIRSIARVRKTGKGRMEIPVRTGLVAAEWEGEGETGTDSASTYGKEKIPLNKITVTVPITIEELGDTDFDMESEINADIIEAFNLKEGTAFVSGNGQKRPEGFMTNASVSSRNSGIADNITMDSIILLAGDLKTGYNPVYTMNRRTTAAVRTLKSGDGQYLWQSGNIVAGVPNQINGYTYVEVPDMDDIAAAAYPIAFGDFRQGYMIGDRLALNVIRDPYALKKSGKVEFTFLRRVGGQVIKAEAIKKLKCSV